MENQKLPRRPTNGLASGSFLMGMWRDSIVFKRTRLCNSIAFRVGHEVGFVNSVRGFGPAVIQFPLPFGSTWRPLPVGSAKSRPSPEPRSVQQWAQLLEQF
jgi:hypothetical protein